MFGAKAATEGEGWTNFPTSERAGKWLQYLSHRYIFPSRLFAVNLEKTF